MTPKERKKAAVKIAVGILAFIIAIVAFGYAFSRILHRDPGYYAVEPIKDDIAPFYAGGIKFNYYFEGTSSEIRAAQNELQKAYSGAMLRIYKLLDSGRAYSGFKNIAYINQHMGEDIELDADLFSILTTALRLTDEGRFNMFAGALHTEWTAINVLSDPEEADPLNDPGMAERIAMITSAVNDRSNFDFRIVDQERHIVNFTVSDRYAALVEQADLPNAVIDTAFLKNAFMLDYVRSMLEAAGYKSGYLIADDGTALALSDSREASYVLYGRRAVEPVQALTLAMEPGTACCMYRSFDQEDALQYYVIRTENGEALRHPHYCQKDGCVYDVLLSAMVVDNDSAVNACLGAYSLYSCASSGAVRSSAERLAASGESVAFIEKAESETIRVSSSVSEKAVVDNAGYFKLEVF